MRDKPTCLSLSYAELTLEEFSKYYPNLTCSAHYAATHSALRIGYPVFEGYEAVYPSLKNIKVRKRK